MLYIRIILVSLPSSLACKGPGFLQCRSDAMLPVFARIASTQIQFLAAVK